MTSLQCKESLAAGYKRAEYKHYYTAVRLTIAEISC